MRLTERLPRETGRDYALRTIRDNIIHLELAPGSMVSENELAAEMGLSRTPVREALIELSKARIVEIYPQKGSAVSLIDVSLVEESRFMRKVLECAVVELDCEMITPEGLRRLQENVRLQKFYLENYFSETLMELDNQFHKTLFEIAEKPQVYTLMDNIAIHFDRVRNLALSSVKNGKIVQDHEDITNAIAARDAAKARALTEEHLNRYKIDTEELRAQYPDYFK
ncbi:GntR family transcriptional regulator [Intestinimonas timonensis]|uniref:GntR family transcriptional regulator n=1 Tax=Intestinimonas timonensis TaxID=1689270 RepID=UPI0024B1E273|nr:GntR family transcriptional regulator [Intestinimonas timonensis]